MSCLWNKLYIKKYIDNIRFVPDLKYGEDQVFNFNYYSNIESIYYLNKPLYNYVIHSTSFIREHLNDVTIYIDLLYPYQKMYTEKLNNPEMMINFSTSYIVDFAISLKFLAIQTNKKNVKKYFYNCLESKSLKYFHEALNLMETNKLKYKLIKLSLKKKIFWLAYLLSQINYTKKKLTWKLNYN